ncbi:MAG: uracil-DNA glycosylase family protein, partial [Anaerolineales bacterium]|nr:uracil-DNA glycosylase family protein [Anaerolineales bacterium]
YPGKAASGDKPPRPECAPRWHAALSAELVNIRLTILAGHYAQRFYLGAQAKPTLTETVRAWRYYIAAGFIPIPHPSPRNQAWLVRNRWFETELVPDLGRLVASLGLGKATSRARRDRPV